MTTPEHTPDWKVTGAHRALVGLGWLLALTALTLSGAAVLLERPGLWAPVAGLALIAFAVGVNLSESVPDDMLSERRSIIRRPS